MAYQPAANVKVPTYNELDKEGALNIIYYILLEKKYNMTYVKNLKNILDKSNDAKAKELFMPIYRASTFVGAEPYLKKLQEYLK